MKIYIFFILITISNFNLYLLIYIISIINTIFENSHKKIFFAKYFVLCNNFIYNKIVSISLEIIILNNLKFLKTFHIYYKYYYIQRSFFCKFFLFRKILRISSIYFFQSNKSPQFYRGSIFNYFVEHRF